MDQAQLKLAVCSSSGRKELYIDFLGGTRGFFVLLRKDAVSTMTQLNVCYRSSLNILGRNSRYHDPSAIIMMLLSGKSQIKDAIREVGIGEGDEEFLVAYDNEQDLEDFSGLEGIRSVSPDTGVPRDDTSIDRYVFPRITDIIYDLNRFR